MVNQLKIIALDANYMAIKIILSKFGCLTK